MNHSDQPLRFTHQQELGTTPGFPVLEPLPSEFDADLQAVDALIAVQASRASIPRRLSDTVYDVTVGLLWRRQSAGDVVVVRSRAESTMLSRLAMAAALGMAFAVAGTFMSVPRNAEQQARDNAPLPMSAGMVLLDSSAPATSISADYLMETQDLTTQDVDAAMRRVMSELEI